MKSHNRYRILYAEDNADSLDLVTMICDLSNIEVIPSETVAEAWRVAQSEQFDLYLLDSRFSDGNGLELCRRLRSFAPHTPILIYSGNAYETDKKKGLEAGANDYLTKPFMGNLAETILQSIEQTKQSVRQADTSNIQTSPRMTELAVG
jgi:DNA-binding response OmpR family regulator